MVDQHNEREDKDSNIDDNAGHDSMQYAYEEVEGDDSDRYIDVSYVNNKYASLKMNCYMKFKIICHVLLPIYDMWIHTKGTGTIFSLKILSLSTRVDIHSSLLPTSLKVDNNGPQQSDSRSKFLSMAKNGKLHSITSLLSSHRRLEERQNWVWQFISLSKTNVSKIRSTKKF